MSFANPISQTMPGFGSPSANGATSGTITTTSGATAASIAASAFPGVTAAGVTSAYTGGSVAYTFAIVANFPGGGTSAPVYVTTPATSSSSAAVYTFTYTAAAGATSYSVYAVAASGAVIGGAVGLVSATANPLVSNSITPATSGTTPIFTSGLFSAQTTIPPYPSRGKIHFRTNTVNASTTTAVVFTATDNSTSPVTVQIGQIPAVAAGVAVDDTIEFNTDLSIALVTANITLGGGTYTASFDFEASLV